jgi:hypothetical protein
MHQPLKTGLGYEPRQLPHCVSVIEYMNARKLGAHPANRLRFAEGKRVLNRTIS